MPWSGGRGRSGRRKGYDGLASRPSGGVLVRMSSSLYAEGV